MPANAKSVAVRRSAPGAGRDGLSGPAEATRGNAGAVPERSDAAATTSPASSTDRRVESSRTTAKALERTREAIEFLVAVHPNEEPGLAAFRELGELVYLAQDEGSDLREKASRFVDLLRVAAAFHKKPPSVEQLRPQFGDTAELVHRLWPAVATLLESSRACKGGLTPMEQERIWIEGGFVAALTKPGTKGVELLTSLTKDSLRRTAGQFGVDPDELANAIVEKMKARKGPARTYEPELGVRTALAYVGKAVRRKANDVLPNLPRAGVPLPRRRKVDDEQQRWQDESLSGPQSADETERTAARGGISGPKLMELKPGTRRRWKMWYRRLSRAPLAQKDEEIFDHLAALFDPRKRLDLNEDGERYHVGKLKDRLRDRKEHANPEATRMSLMQIARLPAVRDRFGRDERNPPKDKVVSSFRRLKKEGKVKGVRGVKGTWMVDEMEIRAILSDLGVKLGRKMRR